MANSFELWEKWATLQTRAQRAQFYPQNLVTCTGDWETVQSLGDSWTSQESGHICYRSTLNLG